MCDKTHYDSLRREVDEHDERIGALERTDAVHDAKIDALARQAFFQMVTVWAAFFLVLLAIIWKFLGPDGFHDVTTVARQYQETSTGVKNGK